MSIRVELPLPPSVNHCYRMAFIKGRPTPILTDLAKSWIDSAGMLALSAARRAGWSPSTDKVVVELYAAWPDARRRDMSNLHKLLADALEGIVFANDCTSLLRDMDYTVDRKRPRLEIVWYVLEEARA